MSNLSLNVLAMAVLASTFAVSANVAVADGSEFAELSAAAAADGHVAVVVHLANVPRPPINERDDGLRAEMHARVQALVTELGPDALKESVRSHDIGQASLYVTPAGLHKLRRSTNALRFTADTTRGLRTRGSSHRGA